MKKVIAFDLDGTLAPSKSEVPTRIRELLDRLLDKFEVCVISGGKFEQFEKQLLSRLLSDNAKLAKLHIMPACGTQYYAYKPDTSSWAKVYSEELSAAQKKKISASLEKSLDDLKLRSDKVYGEIIEDRESQITLSVLGQDIVDVLGDEGVAIKEAWDPDNFKKEQIRKHATKLIPEFEVKVGGLTSIDVTKPGIDKSYGMYKLLKILSITKADVLFIGDRLQKGGNDYPVLAFGIDSLEIASWQETAVAIQAILHVA
jgi:phosphomannomutase